MEVDEELATLNERLLIFQAHGRPTTKLKEKNGFAWITRALQQSSESPSTFERCKLSTRKRCNFCNRKKDKKTNEMCAKQQTFYLRTSHLTLWWLFRYN